jgi:hypothetical protein
MNVDMGPSISDFASGSGIPATGKIIEKIGNLNRRAGAAIAEGNQGGNRAN